MKKTPNYFLKKYGGFLFRLTFSIVLIWLILQKTDLYSVANFFRNANIPLLAAGMLLVLADRALMIAKWYPLLTVHTRSISIVQAARVYLAAGFASLILPTTVGADVLRAVALGRSRKLVVEIGASIAIERLFGMLSSTVLIVVALMIAIRSEIRFSFLLPWTLSLFSICILLILILFSHQTKKWALSFFGRYLGERVLRFIERFALAIELYRHHTKILIVFTLLTLVEQAMPIWIMWLFSMALEFRIDLFILFVVVPLVCFVARFPIAINGIGLVEGTYVFYLGLYGVSPEQALALAFASRLGELVGSIPGVLFLTDLTDQVRAKGS